MHKHAIACLLYTSRTDDTVVAPLLAGNLFEAGMDGHGDAVPTVVGGHEGTAAPQ